MIKNASINILETSGLTLTIGAENPAFPLERLRDRNIGHLFKALNQGSVTIHMDQGAATIQAADRLLIPSGHNLDGQDIDIQWSDDNAAWNNAVPQFEQSGNGLINVSWASLTHRYWQVIITSPTITPELAEMFLTQTYEWERNPEHKSGPHEERLNVQTRFNVAGVLRAIQHGETRKQFPYHRPRALAAQMANIEAVYDAWAGLNPFWLEDTAGVWTFVRFATPLNKHNVAENVWSFDANFEEVIQ